MRKLRQTATVVVREVPIFSLFAALAVAYTWPLAWKLDEVVSDLGDPLLNTWILDWVLHSLTTDPLNLFNAPMFVGAKYPLAYSENMLGIAVLVVPFKLMGFAPVAIHNIAMLMGFALSGYGATVLARTVGASLPAAVIAGISYGFCPFFFGHLSHLQIVCAGWLPLLLAALFRLLRRPDVTGVTLFVVAFVMNGLTNIHWLLFGGFATAVSVLLAILIDPQFRTRLLIRRLVIAFVVSGALLLPVLIPYKVVSTTLGMRRDWGHIPLYSAHLIDYFRAPETRMLASRSLEYQAERQLAAGLVPLLLSVAALILTGPRKPDTPESPAPIHVPSWLLPTLDVSAVVLVLIGYPAAMSRWSLAIEIDGRPLLTISNGSVPLFLAFLIVVVRWSIRFPERWGGAEGKRLGPLLLNARTWPILTIAGFWILFGFFGSLGAHAPFAGFLFRTFEPFQAIRVAARWAVLVYVGLAVFAAVGADKLLAGRRGLRRAGVIAALILAVLVDTAQRVRWEYVPRNPAPAYDWLKQEKLGGPLFELPMLGDGIPFNYLLAQTNHRVPLINGTSGFSPPLDEEMFRMYQNREFNDAFLSLLQARGPRLLLVHVDDLGTNERLVLDWVDGAMRDGHLVLLRRFDRGPKGDYLFAFTKMGKDWQRLKDVAPDPSGATAEVNWKKALREEGVYNALPVVVVEEPANGAEMHRRLAVRGWAASPKGTRVDVLIDGRRIIKPAKREHRPDVAERFPWYPPEPNGFSLVVPKRPKGVPRHTDVEVRVTDGAGTVVHSSRRAIAWH